QKSFEHSTGEAPELLQVFLTGLYDHVVRKRRDRQLLVPPDTIEVVTHELFVEARLCPAAVVAIPRPEPRRVQRQHFVDQDDALLDRAVVGLLDREESELELRIGDDDAARLRMRRAVGVEAERQ